VKTDAPPRHEPYDVEIEQALLGALFMDRAAVDILAAELTPEHFYDPLHQRLFETMVYLATAEDMKLTPLAVQSVMKTDAGLTELGGRDYLFNLAAAAPALPSLKDYARITRDLATRRELILIGEELMSSAYEAPHSVPARVTIGKATERLLSIGDVTARKLSSMGAVAGMSIKHLEERLELARTGQKPASITTGLRRMDKAIGGLLPGDRMGLAGRTGMGKSLCASSMSLAAARNGAPVLIISADMREEQWATRVLCDMDRHLCPDKPAIHYRRFRVGNFSADEWERIVLAQRALEELPMHIDENPSTSIAQINGRARALAQAYPDQQGLLVADFLQKIDPPERQGYRERRRDEDVTDVAYGLGDIVKPLGWALLALIQIANKDTDSRGQLREEPPSVASIRESGGIEMAFDILWTPFRKAFFIESREPEGRGWADGPPPDWLAWRAELTEHQHKLRTIGWKNRDGNKSDLNLDLWCDPGSAAVRDEEPAMRDVEAEQAADDLLKGLT
jgi:replicative DNA helicase